MARARKFVKGGAIADIGELAGELDRLNYVYFWQRPCHPGWVGSMQFRTLVMLVGKGAFSYALPNPDLTPPAIEEVDHEIAF